MANRRFGGGIGGPQRGGRSFPQQQHYQGNNVSPWQGGVAPNNSLNAGLLSQLTTSQQIAIALSGLLQPQQQQQMNNGPPSLLSLNTSPFSQQDNYDSQSRFGNRGRSDFRRLEPYNKVCILLCLLTRQYLFFFTRHAFPNGSCKFWIQQHL